jgi:hypothetical protein
MKTEFNPFALSLSFVTCLLASDCGPPPAEPSPVTTVTNAEWCAIDVVDDVSGAIDVAKTIADCGATLADLYAIVANLFATNGGDAGVAEAAVSFSPASRAAKIAHLNAWKIALDAYGVSHPKAR